MKKAFTLIEINLAVLVMAGGILSVVVLYSLGYRETRQSREDIVSTAYSDAVMDPFVAAISDPNLDWETFDSIETTPQRGWGGYLNNDGTVRKTPDGDAFGHLSSVLGVSPARPDSGFVSGLVVFHDKGSGLVKLGFRVSRRAEDLLSAPLYYTEVRYQGGFRNKNQPQP